MVPRNAVLLAIALTGRVELRKLEKLMYLVDRRLAESARRPLFRWRLNLYGPSSQDLRDVLDWLEARHDVEKTVEVRGLKVAVWYKAVGTPGELPPHVEEAVRAVVAEWGHRLAGEVLHYVYNLPEIMTADLGDDVTPKLHHTHFH